MARAVICIVHRLVINAHSGAGKSTLQNILHGCTVSRVQRATGDFVFMVDDSSEKKALAVTGHGAVSRTMLPDVLLSDKGVVFIDCPGLNDTRASAVNVANGINVAACVEATSSARFVAVVEFSTVKAARGSGFKELIKALVDSFGGARGLAAHASSVLLVVSQAPLDLDLASARALLGEVAISLSDDEREVSLELSTRAVLFHPLDEGPPSWCTCDVLWETIDALKPLDCPGSVFRAALNYKDEKLLREITRSRSEAMERFLRDRRLDEFAEALADLERLNLVGVRTITVTVDAALDKSQARLDKYFSEISSLTLDEKFDQAADLLSVVRKIEAAVKGAGAGKFSASVVRSLGMQATSYEKLLAHRREEAQRVLQYQREHKEQGAQAELLLRQLSAIEAINRGLQKELNDVQQQLVRSQEAAVHESERIQATFLEKIQALERHEARGEKKEETGAQVASLRAEMNDALDKAKAEATAREAELKRTLMEREEAAKAKSSEETEIRIAFEEVENDRRRRSLDAAKARVVQEAARSAEAEAAKKADRAKAAAEAARANAQRHAAEVRAGIESASAVRAEGEIQVRDLEVELKASIEALKAAAAAEAEALEAKSAGAIQGLNTRFAKAVDDFEPELAESIQAEIDGAAKSAETAKAKGEQDLAAAVASSTAAHQIVAHKVKKLYGELVAKLTAIEEAIPVREIALAEKQARPAENLAAFEAACTTRATALREEAAHKTAEAKAAMASKDFTAAKKYKAEASDIEKAAKAAADGLDAIGNEQREKMQAVSKELEKAAADATAKVARFERELALLPRTLEDVDAAQAAEDKRRQDEADAAAAAKQREARQAFITEEVTRSTEMPRSDAHKLAVEFVGAGAGSLADVLRMPKAARDPLVSKAGISRDSLSKLNLVPEIKKVNDEVQCVFTANALLISTVHVRQLQTPPLEITS